MNRSALVSMHQWRENAKVINSCFIEDVFSDWNNQHAYGCSEFERKAQLDNQERETRNFLFEEARKKAFYNASWHPQNSKLSFEEWEKQQEIKNQRFLSRFYALSN